MFTHCEVLLEPTQSQIELVDMGQSYDSGGASTSSNNSTTQTAKQYYTNEVLPEIERSCTSCHAPIVDKPVIEAPLSILSYSSAKSLLINGLSSKDNGFYNKISGKLSHTGGNQCSGSGAEICELIINWWAKEVGATEVEKSEAKGAILSVSSSGKVYGYAYTSDSTEILEVEFYLSGNGLSNEFIGRVDANFTGSDDGAPGNHAFEYSIPETYKNSKTYSLTAKTYVDNKELLLTNSPFSMTLYSPRAAGLTYFTQTLQPLLNNKCSRCHVVSYTQFYSNLSNPTPANGGTATTNELVRMPTGSFNGKSHPGGNICGSVTGSPCNEISAWWRIEFSN